MSKERLHIYHVDWPASKGYDRYSSFVCIARDNTDACKMHPRAQYHNTNDPTDISLWEDDDTWASIPDRVVATCIGQASSNETRRIVCTSFHAG